jgi:hypothetical protein
MPFIPAAELRGITDKGPNIEARPDERDYETGKKIQGEDMARLKINSIDLIYHGSWRFNAIMKRSS